jgi:hypothetical protein
MAKWFYGENGQQFGPIEDAELTALILSKTIMPATLVWREGMSGWLPLAQAEANIARIQQKPPVVSMITPVTNGSAITSLILGIFGLVTCLIFLGIPAVILGHIALNQIKKSRVPMSGRGMAVTGLICGYLACLIVCVFVFVFVFGIGGALLKNL